MNWFSVLTLWQGWTAGWHVSCSRPPGSVHG